MGALAGPGGASAPKLTIDPDFWATQPQQAIRDKIAASKRHIQAQRETLGPSCPNKIATAFNIQRTQADIRVLKGMLEFPRLAYSKD